MARNIEEGDIPNGWNYDLLDRLTGRCSGHTPSKSYPEYWNGGIKWISLSDSFRLDKGYVRETAKEISEDGIKNSSAQVHPAGTVVLSRDAGIGKSGVMAEPMAVSQHFIAWICDNKSKMDSWYLYNWLQFNKSEFERQAVGSTIKTIGLPFFKKLKIAAPPYPEQNKIALILSTWDKAISTTERLIDNSKQQKKALMQQLLTGNLRLLSDSGEKFEGEWEEVKLDDVVINTQLGTTERTKESVECDPIPLLKMGNLTWGCFSFNKLETIPKSKVDSNLILKHGDFLFNTRNTPQLVGKSAVWKGQITEVVCDNNLNRITFNSKVNSDFLCMHLTHGKGKSIINSLPAGSTSVAAIYWKDLKNIKISLPKIKEQQKISAVLTNADKEIELLEQQLSDLKQ
jgi:type I restriction enzyme S subunit